MLYNTLVYVIISEYTILNYMQLYCTDSTVHCYKCIVYCTSSVHMHAVLSVLCTELSYNIRTLGVLNYHIRTLDFPCCRLTLIQ